MMNQFKHTKDLIELLFLTVIEYRITEILLTILDQI